MILLELNIISQKNLLSWNELCVANCAPLFMTNSLLYNLPQGVTEILNINSPISSILNTLSPTKLYSFSIVK